MLDHCAPNHSRRARLHDWCIRWEGRTYWGFPLGDHGKRTNPEIQKGHVKQLVRQLHIPADCVKKYLPQLQLK